MADIFISYARIDAAFALRVTSALRAAGADVWIDQADISPGQRWDRAIEQALDACRAMVVILSPVSVASENVMDEVSYALEERKAVIPVISAACEVPFRLRRLQHVDLRGDQAAGLVKLLAVLGVGSRISQAGVEANARPPLEAPPATDASAPRYDLLLSRCSPLDWPAAAQVLAEVTGLSAERVQALARADELRLLARGVTEGEACDMQRRLEACGIDAFSQRTGARRREAVSFVAQDLWLTAVGPRRIEVMRTLRAFTGCSLRDALTIVDGVEQAAQRVMRQSVGKTQRLAQLLEEAGASTDSRPAAQGD
jgi:ribosomal protein L7/L12